MDHLLGQKTIFNYIISLKDPTTVEEARQHPCWVWEMDEELETIQKNGTWELVTLPSRKTPITSKGLFETKLTAYGKVEKIKARLVAWGFEHMEGIDYQDTFAMVVKWPTISWCCSDCNRRRWNIKYVDMKTTFLNGDLEEQLHMELPQGPMLSPEDQEKPAY